LNIKGLVDALDYEDYEFNYSNDHIWEEIPSLIHARSNFCGFVHGDPASIYVFGGFESNGKIVKSIERFTPGVST